MDTDVNNSQTLSILDCLSWATNYLEKHNISNARRDAEELLCYVSGKSRIDFYLENGYSLVNYSMPRYISLIKKRSRGYPLQYIIESVEFFGLNFRIWEGVFIPRPETELLEEKTIEIAKGLEQRAKGIKILDIGTGCGNIAISLAKFLSNVYITALDISPFALQLAYKNSQLNKTEDKIEFIQADLFNFTHRTLNISQFDLIVSNPPYIPTEEIEALSPEVRYEPRIALDGGKGGLFYIRRIIKESPNYLKKNGILIIEIGFGQSERVEEIFASSEFKRIEVVKDYQGVDRVVILYL